MAERNTKRTIIGFRQSDLTDELFQKVAAKENIKLLSWKQIPYYSVSNFHSALFDNKGDEGRITGMHCFALKGSREDGSLVSLKVALQARRLGEESFVAFVDMKSHLPDDFVALWTDIRSTDPGLQLCHLREILVSERAMDDPILKPLLPKVYLTVIDPDRDLFMSINQLYFPEDVTHFNEDSNFNVWDEESCHSVLKSLAKLHAGYLGTYMDLGRLSECLANGQEAHPSSLRLAWRKLELNQGVPLGVKYFTPNRIAIIRTYLENVAEITKKLEKGPFTLVHGDINCGKMSI